MAILKENDFTPIKENKNIELVKNCFHIKNSNNEVYLSFYFNGAGKFSKVCFVYFPSKKDFVYFIRFGGKNYLLNDEQLKELEIFINRNKGELK